MKRAHSVSITVFAKAFEQTDAIKQTLISLVPLDIEKEKILVKEEKLTDSEHNTLIIISLTVTKQRHVDAVLEKLNSLLSKDQKTLLLNQYLTRTDENLIFYFRLDKDALINQKVELTDSGNCFHFKVHLACFPSKIAFAKPVLNQIFK